MRESQENFATFWSGLKTEGEGDWNVIDAKGLSYESRISALCSWLGFCGCGQPETALRTVVDVLSIYDFDTREAWSDEWYERHKAREREVMGPASGVQYLLWYWLTDLDLMEHGGSVPGWLTSDGELLLKIATELLGVLEEESA